MNLVELNMELKEDIELLEKEYSNLIKVYQQMLHIPYMIHGNLKLMSLMCSEQVKAQCGESSSQIKFDSIEEFAKHLGLMLDISIRYMEKRYGIGE